MPWSFLQVRITKDAGKMEEMIRDFAGSNQSWGFACIKRLRKFLEGAWDWHHGMAAKQSCCIRIYAGVKEVRYHSLTISMLRSLPLMTQAIMGIQHRSLPIQLNTIQSIGTPDRLKTIENFVKLVKERKSQVLASSRRKWI